jgi:hypothetical protein
VGEVTSEEVETFRFLRSNPQNVVLEDGEAVISITDAHSASASQQRGVFAVRS